MRNSSDFIYPLNQVMYRACKSLEINDRSSEVGYVF